MTQKVGQFKVPASAAVYAAASRIAATTQTPQQAAGVTPAYRQAQIVSYDGGTPPTCTVTYDGTTNVGGVPFLASYFPVANDVVVCITLGGAVWILGSLATAANQYPLCLARSTGTQTANSGGDVLVDFDDGEDYDTHGMHAASPTPSRFTPPIAGHYICSAHIGFGASTAGTYRQVKILKNNTGSAYGIVRAEQPSGGFPNLAVVLAVTSAPIPCNGTTDYICVTAGHDNGTSLTLGVSDAGVYRLYP